MLRYCHSKNLYSLQRSISFGTLKHNMNTVPKPAKTKSILIYLIIIIFFLLLACAVWMFFESRIKTAESKKGHSLMTVIENTNKTTEPL